MGILIFSAEQWRRLRSGKAFCGPHQRSGVET
jgi:hypothetical protein